uniref:CCHC-type domain-containing protein n=1 Tax=Trichogramma kaykai TaxID=54128 RepID=A0ABD2WAY8_9HYME
MKNSLLQIEASKTKRNQEKAPRVNAASVPPIEEIVCYRCTKVGHYASSCPLVPQNLWFCYICNEVKRHNSKSCPNKCQDALVEVPDLKRQHCVQPSQDIGIRCCPGGLDNYGVGPHADLAPPRPWRLRATLGHHGLVVGTTPAVTTLHDREGLLFG